MKNFLRTLFPAVLLLALTSFPAFGQSKIATVDLKRLFDDYYKTKLATQAIQERATDMDKDYTKAYFAAASPLMSQPTQVLRLNKLA